MAGAEEGVPEVGWCEKTFPTALAAGRPEEVGFEVEPLSFIIGVGKNNETDDSLLLTLVSEPLAESEIVTISCRTVSVVTGEGDFVIVVEELVE